MARLRTLKPGFFHNEDLSEVEPLGRLLFAGLWTIADRAGLLEDRPKRIKAEVLPYDDCDPDDLLRQLADRDFITRYEVGGRNFIAINKWTAHQRPHPKETESVLPQPPQRRDLQESREKDMPRTDLGADEQGGVLSSGTGVMGGGAGDRGLVSEKEHAAKAASTPSESSTRKTVTLSEEHGAKDAADPFDGFEEVWGLWPNKAREVDARKVWGLLSDGERACVLQVAKQLARLAPEGSDDERWVPHLGHWMREKQWRDWTAGPPANWKGQRQSTSAAPAAGVSGPVQQPEPHCATVPVRKSAVCDPGSPFPAPVHKEGGGLTKRELMSLLSDTAL